jgi:hypothetical protein
MSVSTASSKNSLSSHARRMTSFKNIDFTTQSKKKILSFENNDKKLVENKGVRLRYGGEHDEEEEECSLGDENFFVEKECSVKEVSNEEEVFHVYISYTDIHITY